MYFEGSTNQIFWNTQKGMGEKDDTKNFGPNNEKYGVVTNGDRRDHRRKRYVYEGAVRQGKFRSSALSIQGLRQL